MTKLLRHCSVPGCFARLHPEYASYDHQVCRAHRHAPGLCRCVTCDGQRNRVVKAAPREVRVVDVPVVTGHSGIGGSAKISLPLEPWLRSNA